VKRVYIGVPVLRRYDLLREMLLSAQEGTVLPAFVWIIDNGKRPDLLHEMIGEMVLPISVYTPERSLGVAECWNWFIDHVPEDRIITNDDITFEKDSIEAMRDTEGDLVFGHGYSCFLIRNSAVEKIGRFDEDISPGYAYWEDIDYDQRIRLAQRGGNKFTQTNAPCAVHHGGSKTNEVASPEEINEHHSKFTLAHNNFLQKWSHLPSDLLHPAAKR
jgi:hypothetical protein